MGARTGFRLTARRIRRGARFPAVSAFTAFLLVFGLLFWTIVFWSSTVIHGNQCHFSEFWLAGWFEGRSMLHFLGALIALIAALFVIRTIARGLWRRSPVEATAQGYLILWLIIVFLGLKALILPFAFPSQDLLSHLFRHTHPMPQWLIEERDVVKIESWTYDYPEPPPRSAGAAFANERGTFPER